MRLADNQSKTESDLEEKIHKLNAIGIALSNEQDLNKLLELIVTEARNFTNADGGSLYIKERDRLNFTVAQTESLAKRDGKNQPFKSFYLPLTKESIAGYVAITGDTLNIPDVYQLPPDVKFRINKQFDIQNNYRSQSMLVVPMKDHEDEIIGVLQLINSLHSTGQVVAFKPEYESLVLSLASQAAVAIRNVKLIEDIKKLFRSLVRYSAKAIDARSPHTAGHSGRVAKYCVRMAEAINRETEGSLGETRFTAQEIEELRMAGWLHDIGKIGVRESVLEKTNKLTDDQMQVIAERFEGIKLRIENEFLMKQHEGSRNGKMRELEQQKNRKLQEVDTALDFIKQINVPGCMREKELCKLNEIFQKTYKNNGETCHFLTQKEYQHLSVIKGNLTELEYTEMQSHVNQTLGILNKIPFTRDLKNIPKYAAAHHEYLDGSGYPFGLRGDDISVQSRIMCVADIFDALNSPDRPYKDALPIENTLAILEEEARAGKLDPDIVELFIKKKLYLRPGAEDDEE